MKDLNAITPELADRAEQSYSAYGKVAYVGKTRLKDGIVHPDGDAALVIGFETLAVKKDAVQQTFEGFPVRVSVVGKIRALAEPAPRAQTPKQRRRIEDLKKSEEKRKITGGNSSREKKRLRFTEGGNRSFIDKWLGCQRRKERESARLSYKWQRRLEAAGYEAAPLYFDDRKTAVEALSRGRRALVASKDARIAEALKASGWTESPEGVWSVPNWSKPEGLCWATLRQAWKMERSRAEFLAAKATETAVR